MKSTTIVELMTADHTKILKLLHDVETSIGIELVSLMKVFDTFEWELEKHIFTEEKAIFSSYSPKNISEGYKMVPELIQQHNEILNRVRLMRKDLMWNKPVQFHEFKEFITAHKTFEEASLYPKLDRSNRSAFALQIGQIGGGSSLAQRYPQTVHLQTGIAPDVPFSLGRCIPSFGALVFFSPAASAASMISWGLRSGIGPSRDGSFFTFSLTNNPQ